jgi:outer membrane protein OmpA-like peptidoglycan-associated protein
MAWSWRYGWIFKTNPMKKVMICLTGCLLLALINPRAQEIARQAADSNRPVADTTRQMPDTATIVKDSSAIPPAVTTPLADTAVKANGNDSVISLVDDAPAAPIAPVAPVKKHKRSAKHDSPAAPVAAVTPDTTAPPVATTAPIATNSDPAPQTDTAAKTNVVAMTDPAATKPDTTAKAQDSATQDGTPPTHELDRRWFISPLLKLQFQDFAMLEKNREGYLSNANTLPFFQRGNASFAASAYKNITSRLSFSADLGLSFGHVTNNNVEISQTKSQTFNLLNAAVYYHLLPASYRLQPYITIGINDIINNASYVSIPIGIGAKFNAKKIMVLAEVNYGYAANKNISNTTMYSMGIYIPIKSKKQKQLDKDDNSPDKRPNKDDAVKKKDSTNKNNGTIINNIYVTINMDSVLKAKGLIGDDGTAGSAGRRNGGDDGDDDGSGGGSGSHGKKRRGLRNFDVEDFQKEDFKMDSLDGRPVIRFVVYFEFNEYGLTDRAFANIDRVIEHLRKTPNQFTVEIKGYTDSVGTDPFNNWLSRKRAKMVLDYMNSRGVPAELMQAKAYGRDNPVGNNSDPNTAWLNRRAEVIVHAKEALANDK